MNMNIRRPTINTSLKLILPLLRTKIVNIANITVITYWKSRRLSRVLSDLDKIS